MKIKCMFYEKRYKNKPEGFELAVIQGYTTKKTGVYHEPLLVKTEIDIKDLAEAMSNGATFKPALLNGSKSADFISQQLFALDFDENTSINEELNRCRELNINPVFGYTSFSHTEEHHKFRLVFCADRLITDSDTRNNIQFILMGLFTNVDIKCKDITRLFFGGRQLIVSDYDQRINIDWLLDTYDYLIPKKEIKKKNNTNSTLIKGKIKKQNINNTYDDVDYDIIKSKIDAISALNVVVARGLIVEDVGYTNNKIIYSISVPLIPTATTIEKPTIVGSKAELFEYINGLDLCEYLGIPEGIMVKCILPSHEDNAPSAHIYTTDNGVQMYKCFGCDKARTIIGITEELAQCSRSKAIKFIQEVYNIKLVQSDWVKEQKELMIDSANYLDTEEFKQEFPELSKLIRTRKLHIQQMLIYFTQYITDELRVNDKPLFFANYEKLMEICEINNSSSINCRKKLSQTLTLFTLLNMLDKVEEQNIPLEELKKAKAIAAKYGHEKLTGFYQFEEYGVMQLSDSEKKAKILKENNMTLKGLSREYVLRTFGQAEADRCFPQYKFENSLGTTDKSDKKTLKLVNKIAKKIEKQGYILESDIKKIDELQWRKSIADILNSYGWEKVKLNKELKEQYGITKVNGYPFIVQKIN